MHTNRTDVCRLITAERVSRERGREGALEFPRVPPRSLLQLQSFRQEHSEHQREEDLGSR